MGPGNSWRKRGQAVEEGSLPETAWLEVFAVGGYGAPMTHNQLEGPDCSIQMGLQVGRGQPAALAVKAKHAGHLPCIPCSLKGLKGVGGCKGVSSHLGWLPVSEG